MFFTLMAIFLIGSTVTVVAEKTPNCSKTHKIGKNQHVEMKATDKVVCFKADSGVVHLQMRCYHFDCFDLFKCCDTPDFEVYDGCNATASKLRTYDCKKYKRDWRSRGIKWVSGKTSCLKVVWRKSTLGKFHSRYVSFGYGTGTDRYNDHPWRKFPCGGPDYEKKPWKPSSRWTSSRQPSSRRTPTRRSVPRGPRTTKKPPPPAEKVFEIKNQSQRSIIFPDPKKSYPDKVEYTYKITLPDENKRIRLVFSEVKLSNRTGNDCDQDYIVLYNGHVSWARTELKFCGGENVNTPFISRSNKMKIKFVAKPGKDKGFQATFAVYQAPQERHYTNNRVTGVVIGTACGLVFLALTFLAICHSRKLTLLRFVRDDGELSCGADAIQEKAPPSYDDVMASPEKYPITPSSKRKEHHCDEIPRNEDPPPYPGLLSQEELRDNVERCDVANELPTEDGDERTREIEANDVNESQDRDVAETDIGAESDVRESDVTESDVSGTDVRESDITENHDKGVDVKKESYSENDVGINEGCARNGVLVSQSSLDVNARGGDKDKLQSLTSQEYSQAISTDV